MRGFSSVRKCLLLDDFLPWALVPTLKFFVSIFYLYYLFCLILTSLACLFRSLGSSASVQKVFCRSCSTYRYIFDIFVGWNVISTFYAFTISKVSPIIPFYTFIIFNYFVFQVLYSWTLNYSSFYCNIYYCNQ